jgi:hypothetical protein
MEKRIRKFSCGCRRGELVAGIQRTCQLSVNLINFLLEGSDLLVSPNPAASHQSLTARFVVGSCYPVAFLFEKLLHIAQSKAVDDVLAG